jgi:hypothetical protein
MNPVLHRDDAHAINPGDNASVPSLLGAGSSVTVTVNDVRPSWDAVISYVSGEIFGLRGGVGADYLFAPRDLVIMKVGRGSVTLESQGRVLAAGARTLRVLANRGVGGLERRGNPRVQVTQQLRVTPIGSDAAHPRDGILLDLSLSGCALRSDEPFELGRHVVIETTVARSILELRGEVVRTWTTADSIGFYAGVQFDLIPPTTRAMIQRLFFENVRIRSARDERPRVVLP